MTKLARVVLPLPLEKAYTYAVPKTLQHEVQVGCRVVVPFGPRVLTGLVVGFTDQKPGGKIRAIRDVLDAEPAFTDEMLRLTRWMAGYYVCAWGEVVRAALPAGIDVESRRQIYRGPAADTSTPTDSFIKTVLAALREQEPLTLRQLERHFNPSPTLSRLRTLEQDGWIRIETEIVPPKVRIKTARFLRLTDAFRTPNAVQNLQAELRGAKQTAIVETMLRMLIAGEREPAQKQVLNDASASASSLKSLVGKGVLEVLEKEVMRTPLGDLTVETEPPPDHTFHEDQVKVLNAIQQSIVLEQFRTFLLHGITGSGKTEVYIAALKQVLAQGKTGIVLVPEISLTPQTVQRFRAHLGDQVAVLHSRMSRGERYDVWRHLRNGRYSVVIGPRSAILAPLSNIGFIVVDEEHESSYKQFDPAPRYHARDVAVMRAHMNNAVCVLGSATPSIESYLNTEWGKYTRLSMPRRVPVPGHRAAPLPVVRLVDLTLERKKHQLDGALSVPLQKAIIRRLEKNEQVILLQNRRGYAPIIECQSCGFSPTCKDCAVTLTFHKTKSHLRCHYCGYARRTPQVCPKCESTDLTMHGLGTQRVEEELQERFPGARILRMDLDTTTRKNAHRKILDRFGQGKADILIGTQMIAKGLDFKKVTLVGVVNADTGLLMPDFRASERTFQLLTQVAGRAGRSELRGEVILQTRNPKHEVIRFAYNHDYLGFIESELPARKQFGYPPFGRLIGIAFRGPEPDRVNDLAERWTGMAVQALGKRARVLGPEPAFIKKIKRYYRYHTIIKVPHSSDYAEVKRIIRSVNDRFGSLPKDCYLAVDVDPVGLF